MVQNFSQLSLIKGPSIKYVRSKGGRGGHVKSVQVRTGGGEGG